MTVTSKNDAFTYKSARGDADTVRPGEIVGVVNPDGTPLTVGDALGTDVSGTITTNTGTVTSNAADGYSTVTFSLQGTYAGFAGVFEQSDDGGTTWYPVNGVRIGVGLAESSVTNLTNSTLMWRATIAGSDSFRIRATALTSGTVNVLMSFTASPTSYGAGVIANFVDSRPAASTITAQDIASTTTSNLQDGAILVTGAATANSTFALATNGFSGFYALVTGTWTGTLQIEKSLDGGTTWTPFSMHVDGTASQEIAITLNCSLRGTAAGATHIRFRSTTTMTGTATIQMNFASADTVVTVSNQVTIKTSAYTSAVTITRPANVTAYTANDVVGGVLTFASIGPAVTTGGQNLMMIGSQLECDIAAVPAGMVNMRIYLYNVTPPSALADNAAWDLVAGDRASYLGYVDCGTPVDLGSTLYVETNNINKLLLAASSSLFGYLVTIGGYTPNANSEVYKATLHSLAG